MGYEKGITRKWLRMVLHGEYPDTIPGFPKIPDTPGRGTPNHQLLAHLARVTWVLEKDASQVQKETNQAIFFFVSQTRDGFMSRGTTTEQLSPSHSQWWINGVIGLRWLLRTKAGEYCQEFTLWKCTSEWLRSHHTHIPTLTAVLLCAMSYTPPSNVVRSVRFGTLNQTSTWRLCTS